MRNSNTAKSLRGRARVLRSQPVNFNQRWAKVTVPLTTAQLHALEAVESPTATRSMSRSTDCTAATSPAQYVYYSTTNNARQGGEEVEEGAGREGAVNWPTQTASNGCGKMRRSKCRNALQKSSQTHSALLEVPADEIKPTRGHHARREANRLPRIVPQCQRVCAFGNNEHVTMHVGAVAHFSN